MTDTATTALTTLPLSIKILITEFSIFVNVEKMDDRTGSSELYDVFRFVVGSDRVVPNGTARAMACSTVVSGINSLMMHPTKLGAPSNPATRSGSASFTFVVDSATSVGGVWSSSWISTRSARARRVACHEDGH